MSSSRAVCCAAAEGEDPRGAGRAARAALEQLEVADKANSRPSETVDLDEDVVARNTLAETNIARSTSRASNDSNRISIASQEDFKF